MLAMLGMCVDLGRIYVVRNELQAFVDEAALAAAFALDGTDEGIDQARTVGESGPGSEGNFNGYNFSKQVVTNVTVDFSTSPDASFTTNPSNALDHRFVRVSATEEVELFFLPLFPNISRKHSVTARATSGQSLQTAVGDGLAPFSPDAHDPTLPDFGYTRGELYTLKWPPPGLRDKPGKTCQGDIGFLPSDEAGDRGYIDVGQGAGNDGLHEAIVNGGFNLDEPLQVGSTITHVQGNKHVAPALETRYGQDTDWLSVTPDQYESSTSANGRRVLIVPVNDGGTPATVIGFAKFLLPQQPCQANSAPCCGIYLGNSAVLNGDGPPASSPGIYKVVMFK
jgi:hypothetical protein